MYIIIMYPIFATTNPMVLFVFIVFWGAPESFGSKTRWGEDVNVGLDMVTN